MMRRFLRRGFLCPAIVMSEGTTACSTEEQDLPGTEKSLKTKALGAAAGLVQSFAPVKAIHQHLCAFHIYAHDITRQVLSHHYCSHITEDFHQCVIYDSDKPNARLIGIEYIISREVFQTLDEEEKKFWHSHVYEVKSGELMGPELPEVMENKLCEHLVDTYGKTWHTWQVDRGDKLPYGPPQLMMAFTGDGQLKQSNIAARDEAVGKSSDQKRASREYIKPQQVLPGADHWEKDPEGMAWQTTMQRVPFIKED